MEHNEPNETSYEALIDIIPPDVLADIVKENIQKQVPLSVLKSEEIQSQASDLLHDIYKYEETTFTNERTKRYFAYLKDVLAFVWAFGPDENEHGE